MVNVCQGNLGLMGSGVTGHQVDSVRETMNAGIDVPQCVHRPIVFHSRRTPITSAGRFVSGDLTLLCVTKKQ